LKVNSIGAYNKIPKI